MSVHGSLGALLQGVSQQPPHIRNDGQVTQQINMTSDVVEGLTSRSPTVFKNSVAGLDLDVNFLKVTLNNQEIYLVYKENYLRIYDVDGNLLPLDTDSLSYLGNDLTSYTYDNKVYVINRDKVVSTKEAQQDRKDEVVTDIGLVSCLGGVFSHTYSITVEDDEGNKITASYTAPDGDVEGDAAKTTSDFIIARLAAGLRGSGNAEIDYDYRANRSYVDIYGDEFNFTTLPDDIIQAGTSIPGMEVQTAGSILLITGVENIKISVEDGSGGDSLRYQTNIAKDTDELAEFAPHGTLVKVLGLDGTEDDFYMRFEVEGEDTVNESFGSDGTWREWFNPFEVNEFDETTMPHILEYVEDTYVFRPAEWQGRRTGDEETNPFPSFVGSKIRDVNGFQSRLVFVSGPNVILSRTNIATDWFKQSAVAEVATDPIDVISTSEEEYSLEWVVPFDRDLVFFSKNAQFLITGSGALTSVNASLVETTQFEVDVATRPVSTGRTILFPFNSGSYSGVRDFYSINTEDANTAVDITKVQDKYISGQITDMKCSTNFSVVLVKSSGEPKTLTVHKYYWNGTEKLQQAWYKWTFTDSIKHYHFDNSLINLVLQDEDGKCTFASIDLDRQSDIVGYPVSLDNKQYLTVEGDTDSSYVESVFDNLVFVQSLGCSYIGSELAYEKLPIKSGYRYLFDPNVAPAGAQLISGQPYRCSLKPTMPFIRDRDGKVQLRSKLTLSGFAVYYNDSGYISAVMESKYRSTPQEFNNRDINIDQDLEDPNKIGIKSGVFEIPWGERSDWSELELYSNGPRPITITEIEWFGQVLTRGRRL